MNTHLGFVSKKNIPSGNPFCHRGQTTSEQDASIYYCVRKHRIRTLSCKNVWWLAGLSSYPVYYREPHWFIMGLPEISKVTWQICTGSIFQLSSQVRQERSLQTGLAITYCMRKFSTHCLRVVYGGFWSPTSNRSNFQYDERKRKWNHPRGWQEQEVAPHLWWGTKNIHVIHLNHSHLAWLVRKWAMIHPHGLQKVHFSVVIIQLLSNWFDHKHRFLIVLHFHA